MISCILKKYFTFLRNRRQECTIHNSGLDKELSILDSGSPKNFWTKMVQNNTPNNLKEVLLDTPSNNTKVLSPLSARKLSKKIYK